MTEKKIKADITIKDAKIDIKSNDALCNEEDCKKTFRELLDKKTCDKKCEEENNDGKKYRLTVYLNKVIPDWRKMGDERLYKHAQKVLDNAEEIRRFEIELLWKRSAYMVGLVLALFVAFGEIATAKDDFIIAGIPQDCLLLIISLINTFLSLCFTIINTESRKWQRNWEIHADYLHEILGSRLMRAYFHKKGKCFTIGKINIVVGAFITLLWSCISILFLTSIFKYGIITFSIGLLTLIILILIAAIYAISYHLKANTKTLELETAHFDKK